MSGLGNWFFAAMQVFTAPPLIIALIEAISPYFFPI